MRLNEDIEIEDKVAGIMALYEGAGLDVNSGIIPTAAQWKALLQAPKKGKIYLISVFVFKTDPVAYMGEDVLKVYDQIDRELGSKFFFSGPIHGTFTGDEEAVQWKDFNIKEFPSLEAAIRFITDPRIIEFQKKRPGLIEKQRTIIVTSED